MREASQRFVDMLAAASPDVAVSLHFFPAPPPDAGERTAEWAQAAAAAETWIIERVGSGQAGRTRVVSSSELIATVPTSSSTVSTGSRPARADEHESTQTKRDTSWYDRHMDRLAHAPFTPAVHRAAAAACARALHRLVVPSAPKVAVLDCDNTLWGGAVAEVLARACYVL